MPLVRINYPAGKSKAFRSAISQGVYRAMLYTFNVPADDLFQVLNQAVWKRFSSPKNCTQPGAMDLDAIG